MHVKVEHLAKHYQVHKRDPGLAAALRSVFHRKYETVRAVDDISFTIRPGERVGFLGPNGAGKTTTLKVLAGLLVPTQGVVDVGGFVPSERRVDFLSRIMLVTGQKNQLIWDLPPADTFELNRAIYAVPRPVFGERLAELVELLTLGDVMKKPTRQLSLGERMKCELAAALLHAPKLLFLDEPTIGLDVTMQAQVRRFIRVYNERHGATVLLTSHDMDDVAALCDRVIIISHGKLLYDGDLPGLVQRTRPEKRLALRFTHVVDTSAVEALGRVVTREDLRLVLQLPSQALGEATQRALATGALADFTAEDPPLEDVIADVFAQGPGRGEHAA